MEMDTCSLFTTLSFGCPVRISHSQAIDFTPIISIVIFSTTP